jgi:Na+/proline symporter
MFFGAVISAIMSTASGTLLAPSVTFTENILRPLMPNLTDKQALLAMRCSVLGMTAATIAFALHSDSSIYEMVGNAYKVTLVAAVVPLFFGLFWKRATTQGAFLAMFAGVAVWGSLEYTQQPDAFWPPQLAGLLCSALGMLIGSLLPQLSAHRGETLDLSAATSR